MPMKVVLVATESTDPQAVEVMAEVPTMAAAVTVLAMVAVARDPAMVAGFKVAAVMAMVGVAKVVEVAEMAAVAGGRHHRVAEDMDVRRCRNRAISEPVDVLHTEARAREGVRNTSGFTQKRQARGVAHLGLHHGHRVPQVGTSRPEVWV